MKHKKRRLFKTFLILLFIFIVFILKPQPTQEESTDEKIEPLLSSIFVNESARFHPLLRSGDYQPVKNQRLENVKAYIAVNSKTGKVYTANNATEKISPASLTKLMTAMVALDIASPSAKLIATKRAASQEPTILGVKSGEAFTLEELVYAMIMTSANDAATIVGENTLLSYKAGEKEFIALMNKKAELLGLGRTKFSNTQGFDDKDQYSNTYDLARIAHYAYDNYPLIRKAATSTYATIEEDEFHGFYHLPNWNALLGTYPGVDGLKIGYTENAGHSTAVTATRNGTTLVVIILGAESIIDRDLAAATLLNYAFEKEEFEGMKIGKELIQPRLDEWQELREEILEKLELENIDN
jgi:D-alanyl-D-alanine carboxypeptidase (penicillin-binding protein 5/6)